MSRHRVRIAKGVYRDQHGLAATVKVGRVQRERRFPLDAPLDELKEWQATVRADLWKQERNRPAPLPDEPPAARGTLAVDIDRYVKLLAGRPSEGSERAHLRAWVPLYGTRRRAYLRPEDVSAAIKQWQTEGIAAQTIIHRCRVLRQLYHALDGKTARTPVDGVPRPPKPDPKPIALPVALITKALLALEALDPVMAARFRVLATTGQRPAQVMRATPVHVDLKRRIWLVPTAKKNRAREIHLNAEMLWAWKTFLACDAWGPYDTSRMARLLRRCGWPADVRPYNARHSFAVDALARGVDLGDLQGLLGHTEIDTTRRYYAPILQERLKAASVKMQGRFLPAKSERAASGSASRRPVDRRKSLHKIGRQSTAAAALKSKKNP